MIKQIINDWKIKHLKNFSKINLTDKSKFNRLSFRSKFSSKAKFSNNSEHKQCLNVCLNLPGKNEYFLRLLNLDFTFYYQEKIA